jgi:hypothetical protein
MKQTTVRASIDAKDEDMILRVPLHMANGKVLTKPSASGKMALLFTAGKGGTKVIMPDGSELVVMLTLGFYTSNGNNQGWS